MCAGRAGSEAEGTFSIDIRKQRMRLLEQNEDGQMIILQVRRTSMPELS